jgi:hypothetical protein
MLHLICEVSEHYKLDEAAETAHSSLTVEYNCIDTAALVMNFLLVCSNVHVVFAPAV